MVMPQGVVSALRALRLMDARTVVTTTGRGCVSPPGLYCISGHMWPLQPSSLTRGRPPQPPRPLLPRPKPRWRRGAKRLDGADVRCEGSSRIFCKIHYRAFASPTAPKNGIGRCTLTLLSCSTSNYTSTSEMRNQRPSVGSHGELRREIRQALAAPIPNGSAQSGSTDTWSPTPTLSVGATGRVLGSHSLAFQTDAQHRVA